MKIQLYSKDQELQATVFMDRGKEQEDRIKYRVITPSSPEGYVNITLKDLNWFLDREEPLAEVLKQRVYDDVIAEIADFFPHQVPISGAVPKQFSRMGIGTSVLRTVLRDLAFNDGIRHFYVHNPSTAFYNLLLSQRFKELSVPDDLLSEHLYRRITQ